MKQGKIEVCIWDFNGTILDDVDAGIFAVNELLGECGVRGIPDREVYRENFGFPIRTYYEKIGFDFQKTPYEELAPRWVEKYLRYVKDSECFEDVAVTVKKLNARGVRQIVLSATEREMLVAQLESLGLFSEFGEILGLDNIHAASKISLAQAWREQNPSARVLLIGDTDHDVAAARSIDAECVLVARGHQSRRRLEALGVPVFDTLAEVLDAYF
ncbi:MAG: HAD family hydrolase [Clostridia bacterium]|nr:HAD family hydrolase [Clostridia bacterium]